MRTFRYAHFNTPNGLVHTPQHHFIRIQDIISFTAIEKLMTGVDAILTGLSAVSLITTGLWYLFLPSTALGTAVDTDAASATITTIAGMGVISAMIALPIAYYIYRHLIGEAEILQTSLARNLLECQQYQKKLFMKLLRLRSFYEKDIAFVTDLSNCKQFSMSNKHTDKLLALVNHVYAQYQLEDIVKVFSKNKAAIKNDSKHLLSDSLNECFHTIGHSEKHWLQACAYGLIAGLSMIVITLTAGWGFASLAMALKITDFIPTFGWVTFNISTLAMGLLFCFGIGIGKYKKLTREMMREQLRNKNQLLIIMSEQISHFSTQRMVDLVKNHANHIENVSRFNVHVKKVSEPQRQVKVK